MFNIVILLGKQHYDLIHVYIVKWLYKFNISITIQVLVFFSCDEIRICLFFQSFYSQSK